jgi:hypothetical protein
VASASLELHGIRRSFGDITAVDGLSFSVSAGSMFGFVGRKVRARRPRCGSSAACWRRTLGASCGADGRWTREHVSGSGICPRSAACTRRCGWVISSARVPCRSSRRSHDHGRVAACSWLDRLGLGDRTERGWRSFRRAIAFVASRRPNRGPQRRARGTKAIVRLITRVLRAGPLFACPLRAAGAPRPVRAVVRLPAGSRDRGR